MIRKSALFIVPSFAFFLSQGFAQQGDKKEKDKDIIKSENWRKWGDDPVPVLTPQEALQRFRVAPGFRVELVAAEPLVKDPVFAEWDSKGRLWVCEFNTYMLDLDGSDENQRVSRVVVLEDTDGDGAMDRSTPFVDDMINARSLSIVEGGAIIVESGKMWFCQDENGDLRCDKRTELMEFAKSALSNIEHSENALHFAMDNWMYNSTSNRRVSWRQGKAAVSPARGRGQWGMASDAFGRLFHNHNSIWFSVDWGIYDNAWPEGGKRHDEPNKEVFPIHPTTALNRAYKPGMLNEKGNPKAVTSISGLAVHSCGAFGEEWEGVIFSMSPGTNTVGAFRPKSPFPETEAYEHLTFPDPGAGQREFLASDDPRFRPVNGSFGPDGCLYIVDFHRGVIQHKRFLTSYLRKQSAAKELDKHIGRGRIYRVVPEQATAVAPPPANLVKSLDHPFLWWRLNGQKQIVEGEKTDLSREIRALAADEETSRFGKVHAMWTLAGLGKLDAATVERAMDDSDWFVRMSGLRLAGAASGSTPDIFPAQWQPRAKKIGEDAGKLILANYAKQIATIGYPSRIVHTYKDKEPKWVKANKELQQQYQRGRSLYTTTCAACHQPNGKGLANLAPSLAGSDWVSSVDNRLIAVAVHGLTGPIKVNGKSVTGFPPIMPPHSFYNDAQIADVLTYTRNAWGNRSDAISPAQVAAYRKAHPTRVMPWTEAELDALAK